MRGRGVSSGGGVVSGVNGQSRKERSCGRRCIIIYEGVYVGG